MKKRFLILEGNSRYGSLHYMMDILEKHLTEHTELDVLRYIIDTNEHLMEAINIITTEPEYIFAVQAVLFDLKLNNGKYLYDCVQSKVIGWIVDPPTYHMQRINPMSDKLHILCVDAYHADFIHRLCHKNADTLHLFGMEKPHPIPIKDREIAIFAPGSCVSTIEFEKETIAPLNKTLQTMIYQATELMLSNEHLTPEKALRAFIANLNLDFAEDVLYNLICELEPIIDNYYRNKLRECCIATLISHDIPVTVCGNGWQKFNETYDTHGCLKILGENLSYEETITLTGNAKIVLNISPFFKDGIHDRVSNAMLNGAVSMTDCSDSLEQNFTDSENILFYNWTDLDATLLRIKNFLKNDEELQEIADNIMAHLSRQYSKIFIMN